MENLFLEMEEHLKKAKQLNIDGKIKRTLEYLTELKIDILFIQAYLKGADKN